MSVTIPRKRLDLTLLASELRVALNLAEAPGLSAETGETQIVVRSETSRVNDIQLRAALDAHNPPDCEANRAILTDRAATALDANRTFLALASPTNAQTLAQVKTLTRECTALIRLVLDRLDGTE